MSKNRNNYTSYYNNPQTEEPKDEAPIEEVQTTEETEVEAQTQDPEPEEAPKKVAEKDYAEVVGAKRVNLRKATHKDAAVLTTVPAGEKVEVIDSTSNPSWSEVEYKEIRGFMMSMYLRPID